MSEQKRAERILSTHNGSKPGLKNHDEKGAGRLRVLSWNLLRLTGATVEDVAGLVRAAKPDLLLLQEATKKIEALPELVGGHFFREPLPRRIYGLAAWSPHEFPPPQALALPVSRMPGRVPPRLAQLVQISNATFANVHLSHGQLLNRSQLFRILRHVRGRPPSSAISTPSARPCCRASRMSGRARRPIPPISSASGWIDAWCAGSPATAPDPACRVFRSSPHPPRSRGDGGSSGAARTGRPDAARPGGKCAESSLRQDRPALHRGKAGRPREEVSGVRTIRHRRRPSRVRSCRPPLRAG